MKNQEQNTKKSDVYQMMTDRVIELLKKGIVPWKKTWTSAGIPRNLISKKTFRGINLFFLNCLGYMDNYFLTYKQIQEIGATVKKGEKAHIAIYWKWDEKPNESTGEITKKPFIRYYLVYNIAQCVDIPEELLPAKASRVNSPDEIHERIIMEMPQFPKIEFDKTHSYYSVIGDFINTPPIECFPSKDEYYTASFNQLVHSTGHESRLNRPELMNLLSTGEYTYSVEDLIAELGTCYLKSIAGMDSSIENNTDYISSWIKQLEENNRIIVYAATQAQKAVDFILNVNFPKVVETVSEESEDDDGGE